MTANHETLPVNTLAITSKGLRVVILNTHNRYVKVNGYTVAIPCYYIQDANSRMYGVPCEHVWRDEP